MGRRYLFISIYAYIYIYRYGYRYRSIHRYGYGSPSYLRDLILAGLVGGFKCPRETIWELGTGMYRAWSHPVLPDGCALSIRYAFSSTRSWLGWNWPCPRGGDPTDPTKKEETQDAGPAAEPQHGKTNNEIIDRYNWLVACWTTTASCSENQRSLIKGRSIKGLLCTLGWAIRAPIVKMYVWKGPERSSWLAPAGPHDSRRNERLSSLCHIVVLLLYMSLCHFERSISFPSPISSSHSLYM